MGLKPKTGRRVVSAIVASMLVHLALALVAAFRFGFSVRVDKPVTVKIASVELLKGVRPAKRPEAAATREAGFGQESRIPAAEVAFLAVATAGGWSATPPAQMPQDAPVQVAPAEGGWFEPPKMVGETESAKVDSPAQPARSIPVVYPLVSRQRGEEGVVVLSLAIDERGVVTEVGVEKTSGFPRLDAAAAKSVWKAEFTPARNGEVAVASRIRLPVVFKLNARGR